MRGAITIAAGSGRHIARLRNERRVKLIRLTLAAAQFLYQEIGKQPVALQ